MLWLKPPILFSLLRRRGLLPSLRWHLLRPLPWVGTRGQGRRQVPAQAQKACESIHLHSRLRPNAAVPLLLQVRHHPQLQLCGKTPAAYWGNPVNVILNPTVKKYVSVMSFCFYFAGVGSSQCSDSPVLCLRSEVQIWTCLHNSVWVPLLFGKWNRIYHEVLTCSTLLSSSQMSARAALSTGPTGTGSATRLHSSWGTRDTSASSCPNLSSIRHALRQWGLWRPSHRACWRSARQAGTDFHIYDPAPDPCSLPPSQLLIAEPHMPLRFHINPRYHRGKSCWEPQRHGFSFVFSLFLKFFAFFFFSVKTWTDGGGGFPCAKNQKSYKRPGCLHTESILVDRCRLSSEPECGPGFFPACIPLFVAQDWTVALHLHRRIKQI